MNCVVNICFMGESSPEFSQRSPRTSRSSAPVDREMNVYDSNSEEESIGYLRPLRPGNMPVYLTDGSDQIFLRAATLR